MLESPASPVVHIGGMSLALPASMKEVGWRGFRLWERMRRLHTSMDDAPQTVHVAGWPRRAPVRTSTRLPRLAYLVLALSVEMSAADFVALQRLPDEGRRDRLGMPATCAPGLTALKTDRAGADRLMVLVDCKGVRRVEVPAKLLPPR